MPRPVNYLIAVSHARCTCGRKDVDMRPCYGSRGRRSSICTRFVCLVHFHCSSFLFLWFFFFFCCSTDSSRLLPACLSSACSVVFSNTAQAAPHSDQICWPSAAPSPPGGAGKMLLLSVGFPFYILLRLLLCRQTLASKHKLTFVHVPFKPRTRDTHTYNAHP